MLRWPRTAHFPNLDGNAMETKFLFVPAFQVCCTNREDPSLWKEPPVMVLQAAVEAKECILLEYFSIEIDMYSKLVS